MGIGKGTRKKVWIYICWRLNKTNMKKLIALPLILFVFSAWSQSTPVKIVFDVTSKDPTTHQSVMRHISGMSTAYPDSKFEVVVYGGAIQMFVEENSTVKNGIYQFKESENVSFKICEQTMKRYKVNESELIEGVKVVPDGILEIVLRQAEGWGYIKESHH
jgi:intracellular sulfur oxidation DsrE/DsrF family protein